MTEEQATALVDGVGAPGRLAWDARLETGVPTIDLQHRILFEPMQRIPSGDERGLSPDLRDLLLQLRSYADYHFRYEEDWIRVNASTARMAEGHQHLHAAFAQRLDQLEADLVGGRLKSAALHDFLRRWLIDHIVRQDLPMIGALRQHTDQLSASP